MNSLDDLNLGGGWTVCPSPYHTDPRDRVLRHSSLDGGNYIFLFVDRHGYKGRVRASCTYRRTETGLVDDTYWALGGGKQEGPAAITFSLDADPARASKDILKRIAAPFLEHVRELETRKVAAEKVMEAHCEAWRALCAALGKEHEFTNWQYQKAAECGSKPPPMCYAALSNGIRLDNGVEVKRRDYSEAAEITFTAPMGNVPETLKLLGLIK